MLQSSKGLKRTLAFRPFVPLRTGDLTCRVPKAIWELRSAWPGLAWLSFIRLPRHTMSEMRETG